MITNNVSTLKIHKLTQEQYNRALENDNIDENALYLTPDETLNSAKEYTDNKISTKADLKHNHSISEVINLQSSLDSKSNLEHTHTIADISNLQSTLNNKSDITHNHNSVYDSKGSANSALSSAKSYTDNLISNEVADRDTAIAAAKSSAISTASSDATTKSNNALASAKSYTDTKVANLAPTTVVDNKINAHNTSTSAHSDIRALITELTTKVNNLADIDEDTINQLSEIITLIDSNKGTLESLTTNKVNVSDIVNNLTTANASKVLSANQGVVIKTLIDALQNELDSHGHDISDVNGLQSALNGKAATSHLHTVSQISDLTATATEINKLDGLTATTTELNYVDGVTSNIQTQLDGKAALNHTHNYAGSSSAGGAAISANKLNTNAGSPTQPVYFVNGVPVKTTYTLGTSVPSNAKFTDTHYTSKNIVGSSTAINNTTSSLSNGNVYLNNVENGVVTSSHKISGSGATTVTSDASGNIVVSSTNTTYGSAGSSLGLVKSGGDVTISGGVITVKDDSHNHTIANVDNLQTTLDGINAELDGSIKSLSISGKVITYTKNNGTTGTITTQDTNTTYSQATSSTLGLVKIGYTESGKNYPVKLNSSGQMYVNVPWTDNNTTYSNFVKSGSGAKAGLVPAPSTTAGTTKYLREDGTWQVPPNTNTDTKVTVVVTNPTAATSYYPTFHSSTSGTTTVGANNGFVYSTLEGTTSATGNGILKLGNNTASGTAGNKYGRLDIYSTSSGFGYLTQASTTSSISHILPATSGTVLNTGTTSFTRTLTSGTEIGKIKINGTSTTLYAPSNTDTKNTAGSTNSSSKLFLIGATSQAANPQTYSHDTAYVGTDGCLYSNSSQVVNLATTQTISAVKTFSNGIKIGSASLTYDSTNKRLVISMS